MFIRRMMNRIFRMNQSRITTIKGDRNNARNSFLSSLRLCSLAVFNIQPYKHVRRMQTKDTAYTFIINLV
jgi:hypothetical protein